MFIVMGVIIALLLTVANGSAVPNSVKELEWRRRANRKGSTGFVIGLVAIGLILMVLLSGNAHAAPVDMHRIFVNAGIAMQDNWACHNGGPIHLDDFPFDPDVAEFLDHHHALAHQWAMEGVNAEIAHPQC